MRLSNEKLNLNLGATKIIINNSLKITNKSEVACIRKQLGQIYIDNYAKFKRI